LIIELDLKAAITLGSVNYEVINVINNMGVRNLIVTLRKESNRYLTCSFLTCLFNILLVKY